MGNQPRAQLIVQPPSSRAPEIGRWLWALEDTRRRTLESLEGIGDAALDWVSPVSGNSIGTLLYHLASVEADWLFAEVLEQDFSPEAQALLPEEMRDEQHHLTRVKGLSLQEHLARLEGVRELLRRAFAGMALEDFHHPRRLPRYDVTPEWVLHHLMQHEGEHRGQMGELRLAAEKTTGPASQAGG